MPIPIIHLARHVGQFMHMIIGTLYGGVYLPVLLMVRGIVTQGQVTGHVTRRVKRKRRTSSQIVYQRQDSSTTWASFEVEKVYPLGSWQPVCYDPYNPDNVRRGHRPLGLGPMLSLLFSIGLSLGLLFLLSLMWNMV